MKILGLVSTFSLFALLQGTAAFAKTKLTLWEHEREEIQNVIDVLNDRFMKANPDILIKRSHYRTEDLRTQYQTAALGGGGADLVVAPNDFAGPLSVMGIIKPVGEFAKLERFSRDVVAAVTDSAGKTWGFPINRGNHLMLFVNKDMVKKVPGTLEELVVAAKKATKDSRYGFAYNLNEPFWFVTFLAAYGERPLVGKRPQLGSQAMVSALNFVHQLKFQEKIVPQDCDYTCADTLFIEKKAGMIINGDWAIQKYADKLGSKLAIAPLPRLAATGQPMQPMVSGKYLFFNPKLKGSKLAAAKAYAEFLVSQSSQEYFAKKGGRLPSVKAVEKSVIIQNDPILSASLAAMRFGQPMPMEVEMRAVWDAIRPQLQGVMAGRTQPRIAAATMQKDAETKIREMAQ